MVKRIRTAADCNRAIERQMDIQGLVDTGQCGPDELPELLQEIEDLDFEISNWEETQLQEFMLKNDMPL